MISAKKIGVFFSNHRAESGIFLSTVVIFVILSFASPYFLTVRNMSNIFSQSAFVAILACGVTFVILTGCIDLACCSNLALCGMVFTLIIKATGSYFLSVAAALLCGVFVGYVSGALVGHVGLPAFIVGVGMSQICRNVCYLLCNGITQHGLPEGIVSITTATITEGVPYYYIAIIILYVLMALVLNRTKFGRYVYAYGTNRNAARLCGINIKNFISLPYMLSGFLSAAAGILMVCKFQACDPNYQEGTEMTVLAAIALGGCAFEGGRGSLAGTAIGVLLMGFITNGLDVMSVSPYWQGVAIGGVLILALSLGEITKIRRRKHTVTSAKAASIETGQ